MSSSSESLYVFCFVAKLKTVRTTQRAAGKLCGQRERMCVTGYSVYEGQRIVQAPQARLLTAIHVQSHSDSAKDTRNDGGAACTVFSSASSNSIEMRDHHLH